MGRRRGLSAGAIVSIVVIALLLVGAFGAYAVTGLAVASNRISTANSAINRAVSHQADFEQSMGSISGSFKSFDSANFDSQQYKKAVDQFLQTSQSQAATVNSDLGKLDDASGKLHDMQWLTLLSLGRLNSEAARVGHAQKALAAAKTIAADYVEDGQFFEAFAAAIIDLDTLGSQSTATTFVAAAATVTQLKSDVAKAVALDASPGLPRELQQFMADFQKLAADFESLFNAAVAGDEKGVNAAKTAVEGDVTAMQSISTVNFQLEVDAYYRPFISTYRHEMSLAAG